MKSLALIIFICISSKAFCFEWADDQKGNSHDKLTHFWGSYTTSQMFAHHYNGSRFKGAMLSIVLWTSLEVKDGLVSYKQFGRLGGEGASVLDEIYNLSGAAYYLANGNIYTFTSLIFISSMQRNLVYEKKLFPSGINWRFNTSEKQNHFLADLNSEVSFVISWIIMSQPRKSFSEKTVEAITVLVGYEVMNGLIPSNTDIPFFGSKEGFRTADIGTGLISLGAASLYEIVFNRKSFNNFESLRVSLSRRKLILQIQF